MTWVLAVCFLIAYFSAGYGYTRLTVYMNEEYMGSLLAYPIVLAGGLILGLLLFFLIFLCCKQGKRAPLLTTAGVLFLSLLCVVLAYIPGLPAFFYGVFMWLYRFSISYAVAGMALALTVAFAFVCKKRPAE